MPFTFNIDLGRERRMREEIERIAEVERQREERQAEQRQQAYGKLGASINLNAGEIGSLALAGRADPELARSMAAQAVERQGGEALLSPAQVQALETARNSEARAAAAEQRAAELHPINRDFAQEQLYGQVMQNDLTRRQLGQSLSLGAPLPSGYMPVLDPQGNPVGIPMTNTPEWKKAQEIVRLQEDVVRWVQSYMAEVEDAGATGTEYMGPRATRMNFKRGQIISAVLKLRNFGAPQAAELEMIAQQLPEPYSFGENAKAILNSVVGAPLTLGGSLDYQRETLQAPYQELLRLSTDQLASLYNEYWYVDQRRTWTDPQTGEETTLVPGLGW